MGGETGGETGGERLDTLLRFPPVVDVVALAFGGISTYTAIGRRVSTYIRIEKRSKARA